MEFDYGTIIISSIVCIAGFIAFLFQHQSERNKNALTTKDKKGLYNFLIIAVSLIFGTVLGNSLIEGNWRIEYILDFLFLKKVGARLFRIPLSFGYILLVWGLEILVILSFKNRKAEK